MMDAKELQYYVDTLERPKSPVIQTETENTGTETETEAEDVVSCRPISIEIIGDLPVGQNIPALRDADNSSSLSSSTIPEPAQGFSTPPPKSRSSQGIFPSDHFGVHGVFECCTLPCNTDSSKCSLC